MIANHLGPRGLSFEYSFFRVNNLLLEIKTHKNPRLQDDEFVQECMFLLQRKYPAISGYHYERVGSERIQLLIYGDFEIA